MSRRFCLGPLCVFLALASAQRAAWCNGVVIVDAAGNKSFSEIQAAVNAAVDGDVLLVAAGSYAEFTIDGKGLSIFAAPGATVTVLGEVVIKNLTWQRVVISGLRMVGGVYNGYFVESSPGLTVFGNTGHVRIQDCYIAGGGEDPYWGIPGYPGAILSGNSNVVIQNCQVIGPGGYNETYQGGPGYSGMTVASSSVALYDSTVRGGDGGDSDDVGGPGGDGARASQSFVFASNTTIRGGRGGNASGMYGIQIGGDGGDGLVLLAGTAAHILDCTLAGGSSGNYGGARGLPYSGPGSIQFIPGLRRSFSIDTVASDEDLVNLSVRGPVGEAVFLLRSTSAAFEFLPTLRGVSTTVGNSWTLQLARPIPIGMIPTGGVLTTQVKLPLLPNSVPRRRDFIQGFTTDSAGHVTLGSPLHQLSLNATPPPDCNGNGIQDYVEVINGIDPDCNGNLIVDLCDILNGTSQDSNGNGIPDECEGIGVTWHVNASANPGGNGGPTAPFGTIGEALSVAGPGDTVLLADGIYKGAGNRTLSIPARNMVVRSANGPDNCIIDAESSGWVFLTFADATRFEGITFRNGWGGWIGYGSAIDVESADNVSIENCRFESCWSQQGGAVFSNSTNLLIKDCEFIGNKSYWGGAANLVDYQSGVKVIGCLFRDNESTKNAGGGLALSSSQRSLVSHCVFEGNSYSVSQWAGVGGGAISIRWGNVLIDNCLVAGNLGILGGGIYCSGNSVEISNSTIVDNVASDHGGGINATSSYYYQSFSFQLVNSIVWGNSAPVGSQLSVRPYQSLFPTVDVSYCTMEGGLSMVSSVGGEVNWNAGNIEADPAFVSPGIDYRLSSASPAIDAADNTSMALDACDLDQDGNTTEPVPFDLDWLTRQVEIPSSPNTGVGPPPIVDMGCYERQSP